MARIDGFEFGSLTIGGKKYRHDILVLPNGAVRRRGGLWGKGSGHIVEIDEMKKLVRTNPEVVVVGTGAGGEAYLAAEARLCANEAKVELRVLPTPEAVQIFNQLVDGGRRVSGLFHVTS